MSKKKVGGNTMTLKDFHGGSIPTDLPLPSAPGVTVRPTDRNGYNRPTSLVNPIGRSDHRSRPHSSPATENLHDKSPFFAQTAHIGRNFDEDERKPLGSALAPRRTISGDSVSLSSGGVVLKPEYANGGGLSSWQGNSPVSQSPGALVNSYSGMASVDVHTRAYSQNLAEKKGHGYGGASPNAWGIKNEAAREAETEQSGWSLGVSPVSKLAHASAIEKVSSGMWQSKTVNCQKIVETSRSSEVRSGSQSSFGGNVNYNKMDVVDRKENFDARHPEKGLDINDQILDGSNADKESFGAYRHSESQERITACHANGVKPAGIDGKVSLPEVQCYVPYEPSDRPKLKLLPRTRPLNFSESMTANYTQEYLLANEPVNAEPLNEVAGNSANPQLGNIESGKQLSHRPKLNLKPRSQPIEQSEGHIEKGRNSLFGGARPRELVLKERGVDDVAIDHHYDSVDQSNRVEQNGKAGIIELASPKLYGDKSGHAHFNQNIGKKTESKELGIDTERGNMQMRIWRSDDRRNKKETERQQPTERQTSPDTWRKPAEQSKTTIDDAVGLRYGKATSAVDLVQSFSRSVSEQKMNSHVPGQRGLPAHVQVPFSRLVGSTSRSQINGH